MTVVRRPMVAGNWKMNFTVSEALKFITVLAHEVKAAPHAEVVLAPPFTALYSVGVTMSETDFILAAQNMHWEDDGAYTGEVSSLFLKEIGCTYVILGHSERRHLFGETDEMISKKVDAAMRHGLKPILCVGENLEQRESNRAWEVIETQLSHDLASLNAETVLNVVIAYEPVWAIGTGKTATPDQAEEMHGQIREYISKAFDGAAAEQLRVLYGGSVKPDNARQIMGQKNIDGVLVGGAALDAKKFSEIIHSAV